MSVMRQWTRTTVENLTLSDKEIENDNRKRTGYRVFLLQYCIEFRKLDLVQQQNIIGVSNNIDEAKEEEDVKEEDDDSTNNDDDNDDDDDITISPIRYHDIARAGAFHWRTLVSNVITS